MTAALPCWENNVALSLAKCSVWPEQKKQSMPELIPISALIGDRTYRIKIEPKDEEVIRKTLKIINEKIVEFRTQFAGKDMQDYIAMVLIWFATEQEEQASAGIQLQTITEKLTHLEKMVDGGLQK